MSKSIVPILSLGLAGGGSSPAPAAPPIAATVASTPTPTDAATIAQHQRGAAIADATAGAAPTALLQKKKPGASTAATRLLGSS